MTITKHLQEYFLTFPGLAGKRLDIDCLAPNDGAYSLDSIPTETIVKRYIDGSAVKRHLFVISSRCFYSNDLQQQEENLAFFEDLSDWLFREEALGHVPNLGEKRTARKISVLSSAYPISVDDGGETARYQIQLELIYLQEVNTNDT